MRISVLGTTVVERDGRLVELGGRRRRALVAALVLSRGGVVSMAELVDRIWGEAAPPVAFATLQTYVAGVRRSLEPDRATRGEASLLVTEEPGYRLVVQPGAVDAERLEQAVTEARRLLGPLAHNLTHPVGSADPRVSDMIADALAAWRATPSLELADGPPMSCAAPMVNAARTSQAAMVRHGWAAAPPLTR